MCRLPISDYILTLVSNLISISIEINNLDWCESFHRPPKHITLIITYVCILYGRTSTYMGTLCFYQSFLFSLKYFTFLLNNIKSNL